MTVVVRFMTVAGEFVPNENASEDGSPEDVSRGKHEIDASK